MLTDYKIDLEINDEVNEYHYDYECDAVRPVLSRHSVEELLDYVEAIPSWLEAGLGYGRDAVAVLCCKLGLGYDDDDDLDRLWRDILDAAVKSGYKCFTWNIKEH